MSRVWTTILLSGVGTFAMRASFIAAARHLATVPPAVQRLLRQIPPAALAAIVVPALLRPEGAVDVLHPRFAAGIIAAVVAWRTRNVALTLLSGMSALIALEALG